MLSTLIIVFREVFEAMLIVGIAMAAARETGINTRWIYGGIMGGFTTALVIAICADLIATSISGMGQEWFNATILLSASLLMVWTAIWMGKQGKQLSCLIRQACQSQGAGKSTALILATIVGLAVAREGAEVVLFMHGVAASTTSGSMAMVGGATAGMLLGIMVALLIFRSLIRLPLRYLFTAITVLIALLAAGMAAQGVACLVMIDVLPALVQTLWDTSAIIPEQGISGQLLHALMGYDDRPSGMQVVAFISILASTWLAIQWQKRTQLTGDRPAARQHQQRKAAHLTTIIILMTIAVCMQPADAQARKVYSPIVEQGEVEVEYMLDFSVDTDPGKNSSARHQFELEMAVSSRWLTAIYGDFRKQPGQGFSYQGVKWENIYQLFEQGEYWLDAGLYLEYFRPRAALHKADALEFKLLLEKEHGRLVNTVNLIFKKEVGTNTSSITTTGYALRSKWRGQRVLELAVEIYGSLGDIGHSPPVSRQSHQIGPVVLGTFRSGISYEFGYLFGLTTSTEQGMLKFVTGYEF